MFLIVKRAAGQDSEGCTTLREGVDRCLCVFVCFSGCVSMTEECRGESKMGVFSVLVWEVI